MSVSVPHAYAVWRRNASMYARTWQWNLLPNFFEPVFYLTAVGVGVGAYVQDMAGMPYIEFLAPGLVCVAAMNGASFEVTYNVFVRLTYEKAYDAMLTTPLEPDDILAGEIAWAITRALIYGGIFLTIITAFGLASIGSALMSVPIIALAGLLFASIGVAFSVRVKLIDHFSFYFTLFLTPLFLFSDVFFPLAERLTPTWQWVAEVLPLLHPVRIARAAFTGEGRLHLVVWDVVYVLAVSTLTLASARRGIAKRLES
jgi:lipooligosaccharide transport system permease protein